MNELLELDRRSRDARREKRLSLETNKLNRLETADKENFTNCSQRHLDQRLGLGHRVDLPELGMCYAISGRCSGLLSLPQV